MNTIILKEEHIKSFTHLIPPHMISSLGQKDIFALGLLESLEDGEHPRGILVTKLEESTAEILWIYVCPKLRFKGAGTKLIQTFVELLKLEKGTENLMVFLEKDSDEMMFFLLNGFDLVPAHQGYLYETTVEALTNGKLANQPSSSNIIPFSQVSSLCLKDFNAMAQIKQFSSEMVSFPLRQEDFLSCSMARVEKNKITGLLLFSKEDSDNIAMVFHYLPDRNPKTIAALTCGSIDAMKKDFSPQTRVRLVSMDKLSEIIAGTGTVKAREDSLFALIYDLKGGNNL